MSFASTSGQDVFASLVLFEWMAPAMPMMVISMNTDHSDCRVVRLIKILGYEIMNEIIKSWELWCIVFVCFDGWIGIIICGCAIDSENLETNISATYVTNKYASWSRLVHGYDVKKKTNNNYQRYSVIKILVFSWNSPPHRIPYLYPWAYNNCSTHRVFPHCKSSEDRLLSCIHHPMVYSCKLKYLIDVFNRNHLMCITM